ncbi:ATP-binding protein [Natranaerofaba carboxydovora]|uniref:ATP-binding protein n=1 Tax=Natranaerofaba carboxydovora TaxID=2742683 RepID=UPI001F12D3C7|nr:ATP-binding protein [Natranaerofaba carboxydovora]UMZ74362.1 Histidine kinase-, DNA gyrase B-, and HSP90-like ATPase [Natranaerofaba carboxydovora]
MQNETYVPAHLAIEAMRDNGYKNSAYAIAELMDNSVQAEADKIELLCSEEEILLPNRKSKRISQIAVLDNGKGMNNEVLKMALQFGNGTRLTRDKRDGIGRFGMGLPASSISQCKCVEIWSWQNGIENALYSYLDVDKIKNEQVQEVPQPVNKSIPEEWLERGANFGETGTLVVWSNLDRLMWSKAKTLIENSEHLIGRMYRKFINKGCLDIRLASFDSDNYNKCSFEQKAKPNDPMYLMKHSSCPEPFNDKPMFEEWPARKETIQFQGIEHEITIRFSVAKPEARANRQAGATPHGKHAAKNVGISIVRAGRELELNQSIVSASEPRERWWGIEVEFPPALDELMGVTNNKQYARNFSDVIDMVANDSENIFRSDKTYNQTKEEMEEEGDPRAPLIEIANIIKNNHSSMMDIIRKQKEGTQSDKKRYEIKPEQTASQITRERMEQGYKGASDEGEIKPPKDREKDIKEAFVSTGYDEKTASELAATTVSNNLKYFFTEDDLESDAFFTVRPRGGAIHVKLNMKHDAYKHLVEVLLSDINENDQDELQTRLHNASEGLKLLLMAWARYEDELPDGPDKEKAQEIRNDWGRIAKRFLKKS